MSVDKIYTGTREIIADDVLFRGQDGAVDAPKGKRAAGLPLAKALLTDLFVNNPAIFRLLASVSAEARAMGENWR